MSNCLSKEVATLEEKVKNLERAVAQTKYVVSSFTSVYDSPDYKNKMPVNRSAHTLELKRLLAFIEEA